VSVLERLAAPLTFNSSRWYLDRWAESAGRAAPQNARVLDAGAGIAPYRHHFAHTVYETADFGEVEKSYTNLDYVCRLDELPMPDASYDMVFCSQVLEHVPDPAAVLREFRRVIKPGGQVWLSAPLYFEEHETPYDFRRYTQYEWRRLADETGFEIASMDWLEGYYGTISYQLGFAARSLSLAWLPVRVLCQIGAFLFGRLDIRRKVTDRGMPKNYCLVLRPS
jgi:SAM-dependent methyltransferase